MSRTPRRRYSFLSHVFLPVFLSPPAFVIFKCKIIIIIISYIYRTFFSSLFVSILRRSRRLINRLRRLQQRFILILVIFLQNYYWNNNNIYYIILPNRRFGLFKMFANRFYYRTNRGAALDSERHVTTKINFHFSKFQL